MSHPQFTGGFEGMYQDTVFAALAQIPTLFTQRGRLVELVRRPHPQVIPLTSGSMRVHMAKSTVWQQRLAATHGTALPPDLFNRVRTCGHWPGLRPLAGIVDTPVLRPDGTLLDTPGYDVATGLFYEPTESFELPASPTHADATRALELLHQRLAPLPFDARSDRSAFLAALFTCLARHRLDKGAPFFLFDAPDPATPTLLADYISLLVHGREIIQFDKPESERDFRRQLARLQLNGHALVQVSGAESWRNGDALRTALFNRGWVDGAERQLDPRPITWFGASANAPLCRDVASLVLPIRLAAVKDDSTGRSWAPPAAFGRELMRDRARLISAALTILRAYDLAGRPAQTLETWAGFDPWSDFIAGALVWAGAPDPIRSRVVADESIDDDEPDHRRLFAAIALVVPAGRAATVHQLIERCVLEKDTRLPLQLALESLLGDGWLEPRRVGALLKKLRGRVLNDLLLDCAGKDSGGLALWTVRPLTESSESQPANDDEHEHACADPAQAHQSPERGAALRAVESGIRPLPRRPPVDHERLVFQGPASICHDPFA